ncbi:MULTISPECIES: nucleoside diphosphate kinase regulator [Thioalkalivibrio]|uniref:Nucleoside diphosphate kinase regulator n=1 Tax=Thioalkalivibrio halophilus TaxID=252474 RepID=A0A1V3A0N9_9GAMM|nr:MULTISPECIES: nucleoside diphosphate kinase regulator [Thioalkalivibrio]OOC10879.1 nucleoside diphosphate kinase regulator [Thioalkalivibrio halophilus]PYG03923.1 GreA/GreB family elongation factor [Thioalkalivibrio sp. ALE21]
MDKPEIVVSATDMERLDQLLESVSAEEWPGRTELEAELDRARVVDSHEMPASVVTMNSSVRFRVVESGEEFTMTLVYPRDMDDSGQTLSIMAPVGSALLGLSEGEEIEWPRPGGGVMHVRIDKVLFQPERAGEHHR